MVAGNEKGSSVVEFSIVVVLFFILLFSIFDYALTSWVNLTMQHAVREGTRYVITGQDGLGGTWAKTLDSRYIVDDRFRAMIEKIKSQSIGLFDSVLDPDKDIIIDDVNGAEIKRTFTYDFDGSGSIDQPSETWDAYVPGTPGEIIVVKLNCTWHLLTPFIKPFFKNGEYKFTVASTMRNEKYAPVY